MFGHENTSIDFLLSHFRQINDNFVAVKDDVARTKTFSDMRIMFKYCSRYERGYNSPKLLADKRINPSDQVINANSSKT